MAASDLGTARAQHEALTPLFEALFLETNPIPAKAALALDGHLDEATVRLPLVECTEPVRAALVAALAHLPA